MARHADLLFGWHSMRPGSDCRLARRLACLVDGSEKRLGGFFSRHRGVRIMLAGNWVGRDSTAVPVELRGRGEERLGRFDCYDRAASFEGDRVDSNALWRLGCLAPSAATFVSIR
jgi:hypothetical protein